MGASRRYRKRVRDATLLILPAISDDTPAAIKNAMALRNVANTTGRCPSCGATFTTIWHDPGIGQAVMAHEDWCEAQLDPPGYTEIVTAELKRLADEQ